MRLRLAASVAALAIGLMCGAAQASADTFYYQGSFQTFTAPTTGVYDITAYGAQGGQESSLEGGGGNIGGLGAEVGGDFSLTQGEALIVLVGGMGQTGGVFLGGGGGGGGGGSYVYIPVGYTPLAIAGGGGGGASGSESPETVGGQSGQLGGQPYNNSGDLGPGNNGIGGDDDGFGGGGGAGFNLVLEPGATADAGGGLAPIQGGEGGYGNFGLSSQGPVVAGGNGGFGGGGGGSTELASGGGGGGYTGGNGGYISPGGGGGSFLATGTPMNADYIDVGNTNGGNGLVTINELSPVSAAPEPSIWLLMLAGIGGIGLMLRRAKKITLLQSRGA